MSLFIASILNLSLLFALYSLLGGCFTTICLDRRDGKLSAHFIENLVLVDLTPARLTRLTSIIIDNGRASSVTVRLNRARLLRAELS